MVEGIRKPHWRTVLVLALAVGLLFGCGRKAPPRPPHLPAAPVVRDLRGDIVGDRLQLTWTLAAGANRAGLSGFSVYKAREAVSTPECRGCPILFERVVRLPLSGAPEAGSETFTYRDTLEKGYRYRYKVTVDAAGGSSGQDSNVVSFTY